MLAIAKLDTFLRVMERKSLHPSIAACMTDIYDQAV